MFTEGANRSKEKFNLYVCEAWDESSVIWEWLRAEV